MFLETIINDALHVDQDERRPVSVTGTWANRLGSVMEIEVGSDHRITGTFRTGVGGGTSATEYQLSGFAEGDALAFAVDFGRSGSVAAWTGHHLTDDEGERLVTLWHLAQPVVDPHGDTDIWRAVAAGANEFTRRAS